MLKAAKIISTDNISVIDCTIRNLSETGAQVVIERTIAVPDRFQFFMASGDTIRDAEVAWKHGDRMGLKFTGESRSAPHAMRMYKR